MAAHTNNSDVKQDVSTHRFLIFQFPSILDVEIM